MALLEERETRVSGSRADPLPGRGAGRILDSGSQFIGSASLPFACDFRRISASDSGDDCWLLGVSLASGEAARRRSFKRWWLELNQRGRAEMELERWRRVGLINGGEEESFDWTGEYGGEESDESHGGDWEALTALEQTEEHGGEELQLEGEGEKIGIVIWVESPASIWSRPTPLNQSRPPPLGVARLLSSLMLFMLKLH